MILYHTATQEDYDALMVELEGEGYKWGSGDKPTELECMWGTYEENTCLVVDSNNMDIFLASVKHFKDKGLKKIGYKAKDKAAVLWVKEKKDSAVDNINNPLHYHKNGIDVIGFAEAQFSKEEQKGFHRINAIKYITRYDRKNGVEDLNKAKFYIDKLIEMEEV